MGTRRVQQQRGSSKRRDTEKGEVIQLNISVEMMKEAHQQYPTIKLLKQCLIDKTLPVQRLDRIKVLEQAPFHEMNVEGLVCRVMYRDWAGGGRLAPILQVIVPEELRNRIVAAYHEDKNAHPSAIRTFQAVSQKFYWPGMLADICRYLKYCPVCQYDKKLRKKHAITGGPHKRRPESPVRHVTPRHAKWTPRHATWQNAGTRVQGRRAPELKTDTRVFDGHPS